MNLSANLRWPLVPIAAMSGCVAATITADRLGNVLERGTGYDVVASLLSLDLQTGVVYAVAAALFVVLGTVMAPHHRLASASALCLVGALVAWTVLGSWYFPEDHPRAYQPSPVPLFFTLGGGLVGLLGIVARRVRTGRETIERWRA